jgi:hypothetical protein
MSIILDGSGDFLGPTSLFQTEQTSIEDFTTHTISAPFNNKGLTFGQFSYATIPKSNDVVKSIYMKSTLGPLYPPQTNGLVFPVYSMDFDATFYTEGQDPIYSVLPIVPFYNTNEFNVWTYNNGDFGIVNITCDGHRFIINSVPDPIYHFRVNTISFASETAARFWGYDIRLSTGIQYGFYVFRIDDQTMNLLQSGWIPGYFPPPINVSYNDSVGDLLVKSAVLRIGGQTIQTTTSDIMQTEDDIDTPLENQAGLTITVGRNDTSIPTSNRTYWTKLNFDQVPLSSLQNHTVDVGVQFEQFQNITNRSLQGGYTNPQAYNTTDSLQTSSVLSYRNYLLLSTTESTTITVYNVLDKTTKIFNSIYPVYGVPVLVGNMLVWMTMVTVYPSFHTQYFLALVYLDNFGKPVSQPIRAPDNFDLNGDFRVDEYLQLLAVNTSGYPTMCMIAPGVVRSCFFYHNMDSVKLDSISYYTLYQGRSIGPYVSIAIGNKLFLSDGGSFIVVISNDIFGWHTTTIPITFSFESRPVTDGTNLYFDNFWILSIATNAFRHVVPSIPYTIQRPPFPLLFDGNQVLYYATTTIPGDDDIFWHNDALFITSTNKWIHMSAITGVTVSSDGTTGRLNFPIDFDLVLTIAYGDNTSALLGRDGLVYLVASPYVLTIDPYQVKPSLQTSLIVEYAKLEMPQSSYRELINQNQTNVFTIRKGLMNDIFSLTFNGPFDELWIKTPAIIQRVVIELNGSILLDEDSLSLSVLRPMLTHPISPSHQIYTYNITPGTLNISRMRLVTLAVYLSQAGTTDQTLTVYSRALNVLNCQGGQGGLMFN